MISTDVGIWVGAILTLCAFSYFARRTQNIFFRFAQSTLIGASLGMIIVLVMAKTIDTMVFAKMRAGDWTGVIPFILGVMIYTRLIPRREYLARIPIAVVVATSLGVAARASLDSELFIQIMASARLPVVNVPLFTAFNSIVMIIAVIASCFYFYFTVEPGIAHKLQKVSTLGRYLLMVYFGAKFGATALSRMTFLLGRIEFLLFDWLGIPR